MPTRVGPEGPGQGVNPGRRPSPRLVLALIFTCLVSGGLFAWVRSSAAFTVTSIVLPETMHTPKSLLREVVGGAEGKKLLSFSTRALAASLRELPYVRTAEVRRRFPNALEVRLTEYEPAVQAQGADGRHWLVSEDGRILEEEAAGLGPVPSLLLVVPEEGLEARLGQRLPAGLSGALSLAKLLLGPGRWAEDLKPVRLSVSRQGRGILVLDSGLEVRLGSLTDLEDKLTVATQVLMDNLRQNRQMAYVDVEVPNHAVGKPKNP